MPSFLDLLVVIGMAFLRFGVPALVIVALAYGLKRLDARWEREAGEHAAREAGKQPAAAKGKTAPQPFVPPAELPANAPQPGVLPPPANDDEAAYRRYPKM